MSPKKLELESMSLDELWLLHGELSAILSARIKAEKHELEKRLAVLSRGIVRGDSPDVRDLVGARQAAAVAGCGGQAGTQDGRIPDWRRRYEGSPAGLSWLTEFSVI